MRIHFLTLLTSLALALSACSSDTADSGAGGKDPRSKPSTMADVELALSNRPIAKLPDAPVVIKNGKPVIDVSSIDSFVVSIRTIEPSLNEFERVEFRAALTAFVIAGQMKLQMIASTYPNPKAVPKFQDLQILQMTFGELNGLDGQQVIEKGRALTPYLPQPQ